jgi:hypothetical protein
MSDQERWIAAVAAELGLDAADLAETSDPVLDMVHDVAHGVNRPSAPLTAFLVGLASAAAQPDDETSLAQRVHEQLERVAGLVRGWQPDPTPEP